MHQESWDLVDALAEQEAIALRKARRFRSVWYIHHGSKGVISREQAIWDERLEVHYTHCAFCGCTLTATESTDAQSSPAPRRARSLYTQDVDICPHCVYLSQRVLRGAPAPARSTPSVSF